MPLGFRDISGLSHSQANDGMPISSIPGDNGGPVSIAVLLASGAGLPPSDGSITITLFPNGSKVEVGTNGSGNISVVGTFTNTGDDITWEMSWTPGTVTFADGFWAQEIRGLVNSLIGTRGFSIQFLTLEPSDFTETLVDTPDTLVDSNIAWDGELGSVDLDWNYDNSSAENPISFVILRDGNFVGTVPWVNGVTAYSYTDYVFAEGSFTYTVKAYKYTPNIISPASNSVVVAFSGSSPDINFTGSLNIDISLAATLAFIGDASGIYTLVPGKTHDTLYERLPAITEIDVAIPDPFFKTALLGE